MQYPMKKTQLQARPLTIGLIIGAIGALSLGMFVQRVPPQLTKNETAFVCFLAVLAIACVSTLGGDLWWASAHYFEGARESQ